MLFWKRKKQDRGDFLDGLIKVRGGLPKKLAQAPRYETVPEPARSWTPRGLSRKMTSISSAGGWQGEFSYTGKNRQQFYRWIRDSVPVINAGVWAWVRLCATEMTQVIEGSAAQRRLAEEALEELDCRVLEMPYGRGSGLTKLTEEHFLELFTYGKFAGEAVLAEDGKSIDHFRYIDPYLIEWEHGADGWTPYIHDPSKDRREQVDPELFFFGALGTDLSNPIGPEPLASIPFVAEVDQLMLEDMARSSHNAGTPRLQIKINRPDPYAWETDREFTDRANRYFHETVREFQHLEPDDNVFTWGDVEVAVIGQAGVSHQWRLGREQVIEDVITGLKLFPWVLGRTHKTTQNWVQSQFDLLMEMVAAHQKSGADLVDWLCSLELKLKGISAQVYHRFSGHPDPFRMERANAQKVELENIDFKVRNGYISKDEGAREMGYAAAFRKGDEDG